MKARTHGRKMMRRALIGLLLCVTGMSVSVARPPKPTPVSPFFIIDDPISPPDRMPQVDALNFINRSTFIYSNDPLFFPAFRAPFEAQSVINWENSGTIIAFPGARFDNTPNPAHMTSAQRRKKGALLSKPSQVFNNSGEIIVSDNLRIEADQLVSSGVVAGSVNSRLRLYANGGLADLSRSAIRVGDLPQPACVGVSNFISGPFISVVDPGMSFGYFSSGISGSPGTNGVPLNLLFLASGTPVTGSTNVAAPKFSPPDVLAPPFFYRQTIGTNVTTNFQSFLNTCGLYDARVHLLTNSVTNVFNGAISTTREINVVFVPTNGFSTNVSVAVAFPTNAPAGSFSNRPIVEFRAAAFDVITQGTTTNYITFRNDGQNVFRAKDCDFALSDPANAPFTTNLFYNANFAASFVDYNYTVASLRVGNTNSLFFTNSPFNPFQVFPTLGSSVAASDPTNRPGYVEIRANNLDLSQTRIRGENGIDIHATNLIRNTGAFLDAPFISLDAGTTNQDLILSNFVSSTVSRLQANLNSWSGNWSVGVTNGGRFIGTNFIPNIDTWTYRVLILGACISDSAPTIMHRFTLHGTNVVIEDDIAINAALLIEGRSLTIGTNGSLTLPRGHNLAFTNIQGIINVTNRGVVNVPYGAYFGAFEDGYLPPPLPKKKKKLKGPQPPRLIIYESVVNHGTLSGGSVKARSAYIEQTGTPFLPASMTGSNGPVELNGGVLIIRNGLVQARSDIELTAGDLLVTRSTLLAGATNAGTFNNFIPGAIVLDATNSLTDGGVDANNEWRVTAGVRMLRRPTVEGDLTGTRVISLASTFAQSVFQWAGEDRGPSPDGFTNNVALGRLVLDGALLNRFRFRGATVSNALYVDYLEFRNDATNYNGTIQVDPDFTIYFADSNVDPDKLAELGNGRIQWVSSFAGPQSSITLTYPDGTSHTFNAGLVRSKDIDSDGDGYPNADDCTPIPVEGFDTTGQQCGFAATAPRATGSATDDLDLTIAYAPGGGEVLLNWNAPANAANTVEFSESLTGGAWQSLTNFINGPTNARVTVRDAAKSPQRVYRVRVDAVEP